MDKKPLILVTNDDGFDSKGIESLIKVVRKFGEVVVVAPEEGQSGMSHAITIKYPLRINKLEEDKDFTLYSCNGTPVDCVKLAINQILDRTPDLVVSGINHGSNASVSVIYSGTMAAAIEGCLNRINSIGFSIDDYSSNPDFELSELVVEQMVAKVLKEGLPKDTCLNVNIPAEPKEDIKGIKICRQTKGTWREEFVKQTDPRGKDYYWLTGSFDNFEPEAEDTDEWALSNNFVAVVPLNIDLTDNEAIPYFQKWKLDVKTNKSLIN